MEESIDRSEIDFSVCVVIHGIKQMPPLEIVAEASQYKPTFSYLSVHPSRGVKRIFKFLIQQEHSLLEQYCDLTLPFDSRLNVFEICIDSNYAIRRKEHAYPHGSDDGYMEAEYPIEEDSDSDSEEDSDYEEDWFDLAYNDDEEFDWVYYDPNDLHDEEDWCYEYILPMNRVLPLKARRVELRFSPELELTDAGLAELRRLLDSWRCRAS